jgi:nucleotide-binding universal stress UspA family protein
MIRSALIALDGSAASKVAVETAIRLVQTQSRLGPEGTVATRLTAIAVLDRPTITKPQAAPMGGGAFKKERDAELLAQAAATTQKILDEFAATCRAEGIEHETVRADGLPFEAIAAASHTD